MFRAALSIAVPPSRALLRLPVAVLALLATAALVALPARAETGAPVLLVVGDSISAGYGLPAGAGWVDLLAARIASGRYPLRVVNGSITGDTTAGGRARLPALLARHKPAVVVIELGGNDGLRGGNLQSTRDNLDAMVAASQRAGAKTVIVGMRLPPNYGPAYTREFEALYGSVAKAHKAPLVPFLVDGFGERNEYFQPDRIHPTAAAQPKLLDNVWPVLKPLLGAPR
jgi:acyl-CoA thioesterase-1